ncbi:TPA: bifunctional phosphopantothenoylcysteine decarboxylase/phosphopantothenate--cysteine ligase CoaBC [Candidatus Gastranaerophilales bacterium HUM_9]|nr:MAG TPA: bifunctional phosphopantothenoylcysteine decarboxylase/phosphopantothenate--cysteine ligase CoaBC [Candidatus Gastranaerophilales bacterium HUM_9]HBX34721.1 bifunctional phosphopantothenoylcysteine decarboxylase/phosphopantothenate--cysteine ligase CoaBC [Cyanobacteria bacterium UBA11440]
MNELSQNKKTVLIGITGGIAAYKICELIRLYKKNDYNVKVIATENAFNFVTELTLATLSQNQVYSDNFDIKEYKPEHISLCDEGDILVLAPATANTISKIANGICDNLLTSIICAFNKPVLIAPAMNTNMWNNPFVQENIKKLSSNGYEFVDPESGYLACGTNGAGRLADINKIYSKSIELLEEKKTLNGQTIVITAGGTIEKLDPVRYISNFSSGKMGIALADIAHKKGAKVELISTFSVDKPYKNTVVQSAVEMQKAVERSLETATTVIMAAAVADYKAQDYSEQKIKKTSEDTISITLTKNPDILKEISSKKKDGQTIIGFCAESQNLIEFAKNKIDKKGCDYLVANDISRKDIGFGSDENEIYILDKSHNIKHFEKATKQQVAKNILEYILE